MSYEYFLAKLQFFMASSVATLRSSFCSLLSTVEASIIASQFTMSEVEWSHSCTFRFHGIRCACIKKSSFIIHNS